MQQKQFSSALTVEGNGASAAFKTSRLIVLIVEFPTVLRVLRYSFACDSPTSTGPGN